MKLRRIIAGCVLTLALQGGAATPEEYLDFLYSKISTPDSLDYSREFYRQNVDAALRAREEMPWGKSVPEREFRNFVLPIRINNEHLDSSRVVIYRELRDRVKDLSMNDAVLEINHWLHEKATYRPSDARTSSPLATMRTSFGRCGEESTFGVAAMRAMGIPARQVYTPRWAHTDDNHAWVEVWVDGKWYFLGACEPEPILNLAWFNAPAARGILMNTRALGGYDGPEEVLEITPLSTEINVTSNYAPVNTAGVTVVDRNGAPAPGAKVMFMLYNYGEFYPIATKVADKNGHVELTAGLGDIVVWATDGTNFGLNKFTVGHDANTKVVMDKDASFSGNIDFTIVPPAPSGNLPSATPEQAAENQRRFIQEDSIRNAYTSTFFNTEKAAELAKAKGWNASKVSELLPKAYGNHQAIVNFIDSIYRVDPSQHELSLYFLNSLSDKDIRDVEESVLYDHFIGAMKYLPSSGLPDNKFIELVMCPRVYNEHLTTFRKDLDGKIPDESVYRADPAKWVDWVKNNIEVTHNPAMSKLYVSPLKVYEYRKDIPALSRDVFFVASCRAMGIPAWLDQVNGRCYYLDPQGKECLADFGDSSESTENAAARGKLKLDYTKVGTIEDPAYYIHFTLSSLRDGRPVLMGYDEDATWSKTFKDGTEIDAGPVVMISGQRMADGSVLARASFFTIPENGEMEMPLVIRQDTTAIQVVGNFNSENIYHDIASGTDKSILSTTGRGYYALGLLRPNHEPSTHVLNDIIMEAKELEAWGRPILILFPDKESYSRFKPSDFPGLPSNVVFGYDVDGKIAEGLSELAPELPTLIIADTFNRVVLISSGYTISLGRTMLDTIHKL